MTRMTGSDCAVIVVCVCVCVCVFFPFILDIKFVGCTSRGYTGGRSRRISHPHSFCGACLNFSREKDSAFLSFPSSTVKSCWAFLFLFFFFSQKNLVYRDSNSTPNVSEGYEVTSELPGRRNLNLISPPKCFLCPEGLGVF